MQVTRCAKMPARRMGAMLAMLAFCGGCTHADASGELAADTASWRIADQPRVRIGASDHPAHALDRVYGGLVQPDGSVLIGNSGTAELRLFGKDGMHRLSVGRMGRGPGEFQSISWIQRFRADSILVFDLRAQRFSVWSAGGVFGRTFRIEPAPRSLRPVGILPDGSVLTVAESQYDPRSRTGLVRDELVLSRVAPTGQVIRELGRFPGAEWLLYEHPSSFRSAQLPFGYQGHLVVSGAGFVDGSSTSSHLTVYDSTGAVVRRIDVPGSARRLSSREIRDHLASVQDDAERDAFRRHLEAGGGRDAPRFLDLRTDRSGNLWIQLPPRPGSTTAKWLVMDLSGTVLGSVSLPAASLPLDIGADAMLVRETDGSGVQRVSVRELVR